MRTLLASTLRQEGYEVAECANGQDLVEHLASIFLGYLRPDRVDLIVSDIRMPAFTGLEILAGLKDRVRLPPVILITAFGDEETHAQARRLGAVATLDKPFRVAELLAMVHDLLAAPRK